MYNILYDFIGHPISGDLEKYLIMASCVSFVLLFGSILYAIKRILDI